MSARASATVNSRDPMPHRYLIFTARYAPFTGGIESYTANLARELADRGNEVSIVTTRMDGSPECEDDDGICIVRLPGVPLVGGRFPFPKPGRRHRKLLREIAQAQPARVLVNARFYPLSIVGLRLAKKLGARAILLDHGSMHLTIGTPALDWAIRRYEHLLTAMAKRYRPLFSGVSAKSVEWLRHFGIQTDLVLQNAIDAEAFRAGSSGRSFRRELGISEQTMLVAFVGRLAPEKGPDILAEAAGLLSGCDMAFVLAGEGPLRDAIEGIAPATLHLVGNLAHDDLAALLLESDVFCLPTRSEGFCTSLLEASACGVPAVIPDVGGARELIPDETYGRIIGKPTPQAVADALRELLDRGCEGRRAMGERTRLHVETAHTWKVTADILERAFEGIEAAR